MKGKREKLPNSIYHDFITHTILKKSSSSSTSTPTLSSDTLYHITHFINCERFSVKHTKYITAITTGNVSRNFKEVMKHEGWRRAMSEEIRALEDQGTWVLEELPPEKKALGSKWVYTEKYDENGILQRMKARLVCFGNHQVEGIDYNEKFGSVAKMGYCSYFPSSCDN